MITWYTSQDILIFYMQLHFPCFFRAILFSPPILSRSLIIAASLCEIYTTCLHILDPLSKKLYFDAIYQPIPLLFLYQNLFINNLSSHLSTRLVTSCLLVHHQNPILVYLLGISSIHDICQ